MLATNGNIGNVLQVGHFFNKLKLNLKLKFKLKISLKLHLLPSLYVIQVSPRHNIELLFSTQVTLNGDVQNVERLAMDPLTSFQQLPVYMSSQNHQQRHTLPVL